MNKQVIENYEAMIDRIAKVEIALGLDHPDSINSDETPANGPLKIPAAVFTEDKAEVLINRIIEERLSSLDINELKGGGGGAETPMQNEAFSGGDKSP